MTQISVIVAPSKNLSKLDLWSSASEDDKNSPLPLNANEGGLWFGNFVPPPPRPTFLNDGVTTDGPTTCDLCSWAWQNSNRFSLDAAREVPGDVGWMFTLVTVSLVSAAVGAIVMITAIHCRSKAGNRGFRESEPDPNATVNTRHGELHPVPLYSPGDKQVESPYASNGPNSYKSNNIWSWLSLKSPRPPSQLDPSPVLKMENHYTNMDETSNHIEEALYAELDSECTLERECTTSGGYQNSTFTVPDSPPSIAPSSAYYSDLSVTTILPERTYEVIGLATIPVCSDRNVYALNNVMPQRLKRTDATGSTDVTSSDCVHTSS